jgi:glycosyltransferase involved in cell wall biosynthesis
VHPPRSRRRLKAFSSRSDVARYDSGALSVLFVVENASVPTDTRVWTECLALREAGFDVVVICPQGTSHDLTQFEVREGITIHRFRMPYARGGPSSFISEYSVAFWRIRRIARRLARQRSFAVVHAANPPDFLLLAVWPLKRHGTRFIFDQHDLVPELYRSRFGGRRGVLYWLTRSLERVSFSLADVVVSPNDSYRRIALERGGQETENVFVVRNAPDTSLFRPGPPDPTLKHNAEHLLAYVGTMNAQDGLDHAIRALAVLKRRRTDWHAVFVGDGDSAADARRLAQELGLEDLVDFTGFLERAEVVRVLSTADICLSPEPRSPLNDASTFIKIAEYMALERPVVAYDLTESRFTAGDAAAYADPGDIEGFASRIAELLDDPDRRASMGWLGRARVVSELSLKRSKQELLAAYDRVLQKSPPSEAERPSVV